jgi:ubiquinone/menaquinone biosynthesis C-methylase UbiE
MIDEKETARTQARYQRIAPFYDAMEVLAEWRYAGWRPRLWSMIEGPKVLEVGVGTGKNLPYYPAGVDITAIDLTPGMLERAEARAAALSVDVTMQPGDVQNLNFPDESFNDVVATFVFCSVPNPILGLEEIGRVLKPNGRLLLLEHVRSDNSILGALMDLLDPITTRLMGPHINRRTVQNVRQSRLQLNYVEDMGLGGIFKLIVAHKG